MTDDAAGDDAVEDDAAGDADSTRLWLVDRSYRDKNLVTLVYATVDGTGHLQKQLSHQLLTRRPVTAAIDVPAEDVERVPDADERQRYADQAQQMAASHDPDDEV